MANNMTPEQKLALVRIKVEELSGLSDDKKRRRRRRRAMMRPSEQPQPGSGMQLVSQPQSVVTSVASDVGMGDIGTGVAAAGGAMAPILGLVGLASSGLSAYHGYKRNNSVGWAVGWGVLGGLFPIITPAVAFAQGFGEPIKKS